MSQRTVRLYLPSYLRLYADGTVHLQRTTMSTHRDRQSHTYELHDIRARAAAYTRPKTHTHTQLLRYSAASVREDIHLSILAPLASPFLGILGHSRDCMLDELLDGAHDLPLPGHGAPLRRPAAQRGPEVGPGAPCTERAQPVRAE